MIPPALVRLYSAKRGARISDDQIMGFIACGMAVFDVGLGHDLYHTALEKGIGQKLLLWESPYQVED